jgi:hypothetical protein
MRRGVLILALCLASSLTAQAEERYYVVFFAAQNSGSQPMSTHTFATFVKMDRDEDALNGVAAETAQTATISWLPASGSVKLLQPPVTGRNYTLSETLAWVDERGLRTTVRGPFEIGKEVYELALKQKDRLESGAIAYKALDRRFRPNVAINCIHAVSDLLPGTQLMTGDARGDQATRMVVDHFRPNFIDPERTDVGVLRHLDLNARDIVLVQNGSQPRPIKNGVVE